jgi:hypothetical protein
VGLFNNKPLTIIDVWREKKQPSISETTERMQAVDKERGIYFLGMNSSPRI